MDLNTQLSLDPKKRTYANILSDFIRCVSTESIYGSAIFDMLVTPHQIKAKNSPQRNLGAKLIPRFDLKNQLSQLQAAFNRSQTSNRTFSIDSDDYALALSQMSDLDQFHSAVNVAGLFIASWFVNAPIERLHIGTVIATKQVWGMQCPIISSLVDLSKRHVQYLGIQPVPLSQLPMPSLGQYIACASLHSFIEILAFYFAAISDRYSAVPVSLVPENGRFLTNPFHTPLNLPTVSSPALLELVGGTQFGERTIEPSKPVSNSAVKTIPQSAMINNRRAIVSAILGRFGVVELPDKIMPIVDRGASAVNMTKQDMQMMLWAMPKNDLTSYLQFTSNHFRNYIQEHHLTLPSPIYFDLVREGFAPFNCEIIPEYSLFPGTMAKTPSTQELTSLMLLILKKYSVTQLHPLISTLIASPKSIKNWTDKDMMTAAWLLPIEKLMYLTGNKTRSLKLEYQSRSLSPLPSDNFWEQVESGLVPYPNGVSPAHKQDIEKEHEVVEVEVEKEQEPLVLNRANQAIYNRICKFMKTYTTEPLPEVIKYAIQHKETLNSISSERLAELVWSLPFLKLEELFKTTTYKIHKRLKQDNLVPPANGFWLQISNGHLPYPNGRSVAAYDSSVLAQKDRIYFDLAGLTTNQVRFLSEARIKLKQYTNTLPEALYQATKQRWTLESITKEQLSLLIWSSPQKMIAELLGTTVYSVQVKAKEMGTPTPIPFFWDNVRKGEIKYPAGKVATKYAS